MPWPVPSSIHGYEAAQTELQLLQALRERDELFLIVAEESTARADAESSLAKLEAELSSLRDALKQSAGQHCHRLEADLQAARQELLHAQEAYAKDLAEAEQRAQAQADIDRDRLLQGFETDRLVLEVQLSEREEECSTLRSRCAEAEAKVARLMQQLEQAPAAYHQDVHIKALISRIAELETQLERAQRAAVQPATAGVGGGSSQLSSGTAQHPWSPLAAHESDSAHYGGHTPAQATGAGLSLPASLEHLPELVQAQDYVTLHSHASALEAHCAELEAHCHVLSEDVQHAGASMQLLQQQLETSQAETSALRDTIRSLEEQLESRQSRVDDLLHAHGAEANALEDHLRATESALHDVEQERESVKHELAQAREVIRDLEDEREAVTRRLQEADEQVEKLQAQLTAFDRQLLAAARSPATPSRQPSPPSSSADPAALAQSQAEAQRLQLQLTEERSRADDLQRQLDNAGEHAELTSGLARELSSQLDDEISRRKAAEDTAADAQYTCAAATRQVEQIQAQLSERENLVNALQQTVAAQQIRIAELEAICAAADVAPHVSPSKSPAPPTPALPLFTAGLSTANGPALAAADLASMVAAVPEAPSALPRSHSFVQGQGQGQSTGFERLDSAATPQDESESLAYPTARSFVQYLRSIGLRKAQLILGIDCTKSNLWNGKDTFHGRPLHDVSDPVDLNPYQAVMSVFGRMLTGFDHDGMIPLYGFGCERTRDLYVFPFRQFDPNLAPAAGAAEAGTIATARSESSSSASSSSSSENKAVDVFCNGLDDVLATYARVIPSVPLAGPTSFAPLIRKAMEHVKKEKEKCLTVLVIIADGQVTAVKETETAIVEASRYPLSIICVGVGDGPWTDMNRFDDGLPQRKVDNFQFVEFAAVQQEAKEAGRPFDDYFTLSVLAEMPVLIKSMKKHRIL